MMAQRAGHSVRAEIHDRPTLEAMVTPNWVKKVPEVPGMNITGMNTAMNTSVHETTATDTSLIAWRVASRASLIPFSIFAITASTTTMASSTTVPIASTRANSVRMLSEKPANETTAKVPSSDTIIEIEGMMVALKFCRKKNTTRITRMMAMTSVSTTLWMAAKRKSSEVIRVTNSSPAGIVSLACSNILLMAAFTWVALAPGAANTMNIAPGRSCMFDVKL